MAWKINKISIENFKFFYKPPFELSPEGKNVLLYGENGSGKSSIYWAAYTHFQSALKQPIPSDAGKYFNPLHSHKLRNLYSDDTDNSGIEIEFISSNGVKKSYVDSNRIINTSVAGDLFMKETAYASDFMNYKFLSCIFDFKNSKSVDVFSIFEEDLFPTMDFSENAYHVENGLKFSCSNAKGWWNYIESVYNDGKPGILTTRSNAGHTYKQDSKYSTYQNLISDFNDQLRKQLVDIANEANNKLKNDFNLDVKIWFSLEGAQFDKKLANRVFDGQLHAPKIILQASVIDSQYPLVEKQTIFHPRSFFNEAKLTCMALAIRLAFFDRKYRSDECAQIVFVDDLLISLDMCHRRTVIEILLNFCVTHQVFIFTHDKAFFEYVKDKIAQRNNSCEWKYFELYRGDSIITKTTIPSACLMKSETYIEKAKRLFSNNDYAAAANMLRKCCEHQLHRILPYGWQLDRASDGASQIADLSKLINLIPQFCQYYRIPGSITPNLNQYREKILNPSSHDDVMTTVYKAELVDAMNEISELPLIQHEFIVKSDQCCSREFSLSETYNGKTINLVFYFLEPLARIIYKGIVYYGNPKIHVAFSDEKKISIKKYCLNTLIERVNAELAYPADVQVPRMETIVHDKNTLTSIALM